MPFTALQLTTFFTSNLQMALTPDQRGALQREGLVTVHDFEDFKEEELKVAFKNARSGIPGTPTVQAIPEVRAQDGSVIQALVQRRHIGACFLPQQPRQSTCHTSRPSGLHPR